MRTIIHHRLRFFVVFGTLLNMFLVMPQAFAQSSLQNTNTGIQPTTNQAQTSVNTQNQVGGLQNNNGQSVLNQNGVQPLGVVSNPQQTTPDAVASPGNTLKTDLTKNGGNNNFLWVVIAIPAILLGIFMYRQLTQPELISNKPAAVALAPVVKPEPIKPPGKKKQTRKNRKKTAKR